MLTAIVMSLTAAASTGTETGVGFRKADASALNDGIVLQGHYRMPVMPTLMAEVTGGYSLARGENGISGLAQTLAGITGGEYSEAPPIRARTETWSIQGVADWSIIERANAKGWTGGPRLVGGLFIYGAQDWDVEYADFGIASDLQATGALIGAVAGVSLDVWGQSNFGVRCNILNRFTFAPPEIFLGTPADEATLRRSIVTSFDFLWRL